jgi:hypothetical protein
VRRNQRLLDMDVVVVVVVVVIVVLGWLVQIAFMIRVSHLRSEEDSNIARIADLRSQINAARDKLQSIRIGEYQPSDREIAEYTARKVNTSSELRCFFCDEPLSGNALVCCKCGRPNYHNLDGVAEKDKKVRRIMVSSR